MKLMLSIILSIKSIEHSGKVIRFELDPFATGRSILRAAMFTDFMAMLFCSVARRENRRIASYVAVFATQLPDKRAR